MGAVLRLPQQQCDNYILENKDSVAGYLSPKDPHTFGSK